MRFRVQQGKGCVTVTARVVDLSRLTSARDGHTAWPFWTRGQFPALECRQALPTKSDVGVTQKGEQRLPTPAVKHWSLHQIPIVRAQSHRQSAERPEFHVCEYSNCRARTSLQTYQERSGWRAERSVSRGLRIR